MRQVEPEQLTLFDLGPDMAGIRRRAAELRRLIRARSTVIAYESAWRSFEAWCASAGRASLPASGETLALYVAARLEAGRRATGLEQHVAAIAFRHRSDGLAMPDRTEVRAVIAGAKRAASGSGFAAGKAALSAGELRRICGRLVRDGGVVALRDRAVLCLGFASGLRRSNLANLDLADVRFERRGLVVAVRRSKTDQEGRGVDLGILRGVRPDTCPVRALRAWLVERGPWEGPLFSRVRVGGVVTRDRLSTDAVARIVQAAVSSIGLDARRYGAHSLRAGFATAAADQGATAFEIMRVTQHRSIAMVQRYVRHTEVFPRRSPLGRAV